jgi:hypothetical protein
LAVFGCVQRVIQTVGVLHLRAGDECKFTFFASTSGKPSDCSARLNQLLRGTLMLAEDVTGTSVRRAIVDNFMSDFSKTKDEKRGEKFSQSSASIAAGCTVLIAAG